MTRFISFSLLGQIPLREPLPAASGLGAPGPISLRPARQCAEGFLPLKLRAFARLRNAWPVVQALWPWPVFISTEGIFDLAWYCVGATKFWNTNSGTRMGDPLLRHCRRCITTRWFSSKATKQVIVYSRECQGFKMKVKVDDKAEVDHSGLHKTIPNKVSCEGSRFKAVGFRHGLVCFAQTWPG